MELAVDNTLPMSGSATRAGWNSSGSGLIGMRDRVEHDEPLDALGPGAEKALVYIAVPESLASRASER